MANLREMLGTMVAADHRHTADILDTIRHKIGKEDVDAWNALITAAGQLRTEAERRDPEGVLYKALNDPDNGLYGGHDTKYRFENGRYVNRYSGEAIPLDEPIMIFRARDKHALDTIKAYHEMLEDPNHRDVVYRLICDFDLFAQEHPERMREPTTSVPSTETDDGT